MNKIVYVWKVLQAENLCSAHEINDKECEWAAIKKNEILSKANKISTNVRDDSTFSCWAFLLQIDNSFRTTSFTQINPLFVNVWFSWRDVAKVWDDSKRAIYALKKCIRQEKNEDGDDDDEIMLLVLKTGYARTFPESQKRKFPI